MERIVPTLAILAVVVLLLGLTFANIMIAQLDLNPWNLVIALSIAAMKTVLIVGVFMELSASPKVMWLVAGGGLLWFLLIMLGTMDDYLTRAWLPIPGK